MQFGKNIKNCNKYLIYKLISRYNKTNLNKNKTQEIMQHNISLCYIKIVQYVHYYLSAILNIHTLVESRLE